MHKLLLVIHNTVLPFIRSIWGSFKEAFGENHDWISLKKQYPRFFSFIHSRLDTSHFRGLSLTLFSVLVLYIIALFGGLTVIIIIGMSRIYFGVHYVSDVWAGYLVGAMWMVITVAMSECQRYHASSKKLDLKQSHHLALFIGIVVFVCYLFYLY